MIESKRVQREYAFDVAASPEHIFPLLCPVREREWIKGWSADLVYTASGVAEDHAVFTTDFPDRGRGIWVVSHYDLIGFEIGFAVFYPGMYVERLDVQLTRAQSGKTRTRWRRTYTSLTEDGRRYLERNTGEILDHRMEKQKSELQAYFESGDGSA